MKKMNHRKMEWPMTYFGSSTPGSACLCATLRGTSSLALLNQNNTQRLGLNSTKPAVTLQSTPATIAYDKVILAEEWGPPHSFV